ncbi:homeobox protein XHOX-7.1-like [Maniola hyperantus]|uniref:homeobox protein XHOX-7.1-like n=1 Tax=Aphantopus hyperantus TaxID=2795564 RepID=UPI00156906B7|nr:homeobox protein ceh-36-like [Maniola hyperantus]
MNLSPMSSAKCGSSDFSIERILSEDSNREGSDEAPSWLCCTRYQPPRLPRASNACRARRSGRHARVPFTGAQAAALEAAYARAPYLAPPALRALAAALQLRDDRIKIWFQNRRARERREKSGSITPPRAVTLPSTASPQTTSNPWIPISNQALHTTFNIRPHGINNLGELTHNYSYNVRSEMNSFGESGENKYLSQSYISSDDSNGSRCDSPLDVENID